jgi:sulfonate transport system permease protein
MSADPGQNLAVTRGRRAGRLARPFKILIGLIPIVVLLLICQLLGSGAGQFPKTSEWIQQLGTLGGDGELQSATLSTVKSVLIALAISTVAGAAIGAVVGRSALADRACSPLFNFARVLPVAALIPIAAVIAGYSEGMKVTIVVIAGIWPVLLQTRSATRAIHGVVSDTARTLHLGLWGSVRKIFLPILIPDIIAGVRVGAPMLLVVVIVVEMITGLPGLGAELTTAQENYNAGLAYGLILIISALALLVNIVIAFLERLALLRWPAPVA